SRRADFYVQLFDSLGKSRTETAAVPPEELAQWSGEGRLRVAGAAVEGALAALSARRDVEPVANSAPDARGVLVGIRRWPERADPSVRPLYLLPPDVSFPRPRQRRPS